MTDGPQDVECPCCHERIAARGYETHLCTEKGKKADPGAAEREEWAQARIGEWRKRHKEQSARIKELEEQLRMSNGSRKHWFNEAKKAEGECTRWFNEGMETKARVGELEAEAGEVFAKATAEKPDYLALMSQAIHRNGTAIEEYGIPGEPYYTFDRMGRALEAYLVQPWTPEDARRQSRSIICNLLAELKNARQAAALIRGEEPKSDTAIDEANYAIDVMMGGKHER